MKAILKLTVMMLVLAGGLGSCDKNENYPKEIPFTDYSLESTSCQWTNLEFNKAVIINSDEELQDYLICSDDNYSKIDFSKHSLLLLKGGATNGILSIRTDFLQETINKYTLKVSIYTDKTTIALPWLIAIITPQINNQSIITLDIQQK